MAGKGKKEGRKEGGKRRLRRVQLGTMVDDGEEQYEGAKRFCGGSIFIPYKLLLAHYGPYPVALKAGLLPQLSVRPSIHLDDMDGWDVSTPA